MHVKLKSLIFVVKKSYPVNNYKFKIDIITQEQGVKHVQS